MSNGFFTKINYSASNEDSESERTSLKICPKDVVLCITGSGARPLDLLIDSPHRLISIDFNPTQNYLLELKVAGIKQLTYEEFCSFIGLTFSNNRMAVFSKIKATLSAQARDYWLNNLDVIKNGVLYCGTWEKFLIQMLNYAKPREKMIDQLMSANTLKEQQIIWTQNWDTWVWRLYLRIISNRFLWKHIVNEPGAHHIPRSFSMYKYIKSRLDHLGKHIHMNQSHFANLMFKGSYNNQCKLPIHLREKFYNKIRENIDQLSIVTAALPDYLQNTQNQISAFSLSDFSSYSNEEDYNKIWSLIINSAEDGARFCERQFLVKRDPTTHHPEIFRDKQLERQLFDTDESFIYSFCVGKINK